MKKILGKLKKILAIIFENFWDNTKIVKNYTEFGRISIERIRKKFEIVSEGFSEILKKFKKNRNILRKFLNKITQCRNLEEMSQDMYFNKKNIS